MKIHDAVLIWSLSRSESNELAPMKSTLRMRTRGPSTIWKTSSPFLRQRVGRNIHRGERIVLVAVDVLDRLLGQRDAELIDRLTLLKIRRVLAGPGCRLLCCP